MVVVADVFNQIVNPVVEGFSIAYNIADARNILCRDLVDGAAEFVFQ